jgi:hypothetical protein
MTTAKERAPFCFWSERLAAPALWPWQASACPMVPYSPECPIIHAGHASEWDWRSRRNFERAEGVGARDAGAAATVPQYQCGTLLSILSSTGSTTLEAPFAGVANSLISMVGAHGLEPWTR